MQHADAIILGGGLVGLTLAIALTGMASVIVVDPADPAGTQIVPGYDGRATAISSSSWRMLETIGVAARLEGVTCAIRAIRVSEGLKPGGILFAPEADDDPLGIMVENRLLRAALRDTALASDSFDDAGPARGCGPRWHRRPGDARRWPGRRRTPAGRKRKGATRRPAPPRGSGCAMALRPCRHRRDRRP